MPRKPKSRDGLTAGERVALYEAKQAQRLAELSQSKSDSESQQAVKGGEKPDVSLPKPEIKLPKPQHATVRVDLGLEVGKIKPMHGMCNGPVSYGADISALYREIGVPAVRFAGTDTAISCLAVDVSRIFKDAHADPHDEASYDFAVTDKYVTAACNVGARVTFRLGESVDRAGQRRVTVPEDLDVYSTVCLNIIKHYNDYWARGYAFGIERFEIWSFDGNASQEQRSRALELYRRLSSAIKVYDSTLKVGGMCFDSESEARDFIKYCRKNHCPLDFLTLTAFCSDPCAITDKVNRLAPTLKNLGYYDCEIIIGEWAYIAKNVDKSTDFTCNMMNDPAGDATSRAALFAEQSGIRGAAYAISSMIEMQNNEEISSAHTYDGQPAVSAWCPICDRFGLPTKTFYAYKMFGELYRSRLALYCVSEQSEGYAHSGIYAAAAKNARGEVYILISSFEGCGVVDLRLDSIPSELYTAEVYILDGVKSLERGDSVQLSGTKKRLLLNISEYGAIMVKIY